MTDVEVVENNYCLGIMDFGFASNQFVFNTCLTPLLLVLGTRPFFLCLFIHLLNSAPIFTDC